MNCRRAGVTYVGARQSRHVKLGLLCAPQGADAAATLAASLFLACCVRRCAAAALACPSGRFSTSCGWARGMVPS